MSVDSHRSGRGVVEPGNQRHERRLAGTGCPDHGDRLAGLDDEIDVVQNVDVGIAGGRTRSLERRDRHLGRLRVAERHVFELDTPARVDEIDRTCSIFDRHRRVEDFEDTVETHERSQQIDTGIGETGERLVHPRDESGERDQGSRRDVTRHHQLSTDAVDSNCSERADEPEGHEEDSPVHRRANSGVAHPGGFVGESADLVVVPSEQLDEQCPGHVEALRHLGVHLGIEAHLLTRDLLKLATHSLGRNDEDRQHHQ